MSTLQKLIQDAKTLTWKFGDNSILNNYTEHTSCNEIFHAVCDEIGNFMTNYGFKYSSSRPKLTCKRDDLTLQIAFWSSRSNMPGSHVNLEIITSIFSKKLAQLDKAAPYDAKGFILGHTDLIYRVEPDWPQGWMMKKLLDGTVLEESINDKKREPFCVHVHNYNIYGLTTEKFVRIIQYLSNISVEPFLSLDNRDGLINVIKNIAKGGFGRETNRLIKFVELTYENPGDILNVINEKVRLYSTS